MLIVIILHCPHQWVTKRNIFMSANKVRLSGNRVNKQLVNNNGLRDVYAAKDVVCRVRASGVQRATADKVFSIRTAQPQSSLTLSLRSANLSKFMSVVKIGILKLDYKFRGR